MNNRPGQTDLTTRGVSCRASPALFPVFSKEAWAEIARSLRLSGREQQILLSVFEDHTERTTAATLGISPRTVHAHMERLHHKLGANTRSQLVQRVMWEFVRLTAMPDSKLDPICGNRSVGRCPLAG